MDTIIYNLDKLYYSFNSNSDLNYSDIIDQLILLEYEVIEPKTQIDQNYKVQKLIIKNNIHLATLHLDSRYKANLNTIKFFNKSLYTAHNEVISLCKVIDLYYNNNTYVSRLEIALDSNTNFIKRYTNLIKSNKLILADNFQGDYYGNEYNNNINTRNKKSETKYMFHKNDSFNSEKNTAKKPHFRIENKKNLIKKDKKRQYIEDKLKEQGIDISKDYYRFEVIIPSHQALTKSINTEYVIEDERFTRQQFNNLTTLEQLGYMKIGVIEHYKLDIKQLLNSDNYKLSIFNIYGNKTFVKGLDKIIKTSTPIMNITTKKTDSIKRNKRETKEQEDIINNAVQGQLNLMIRRGLINSENLEEINKMIKRNKFNNSVEKSGGGLFTNL